MGFEGGCSSFLVGLVGPLRLVFSFYLLQKDLLTSFFLNQLIDPFLLNLGLSPLLHQNIFELLLLNNMIQSNLLLVLNFLESDKLLLPIDILNLHPKIPQKLLFISINLHINFPLLPLQQLIQLPLLRL